MKYIKGTYNNMSYALGRIPLIKSYTEEVDIARENLYYSYYVEKLDGNTLPLTYQMKENINIKIRNW